MPEIANLSVFIIAAVVLVIIPGPAVLFIVGQSLEQGPKAGIISSLGLMAGAVIHILAAVLGISAILHASALAFNVVKYLGAVYLIYLGLQQWFSKAQPARIGSGGAKSNAKIFTQGIIVNVLNPKAALFFLAFLPQFVRSDQGPVAYQMLFLGALFLVIAFISDALYAFLAGFISNWLKRNTRLLNRQRYLSGSIYIGLGIFTAFLDSELE